jgi:GTP 3',8-cyclase
VTYSLVHGRIQTRSLEVHVTDHCNLKCRQCCSLSPFLPPWFADPETMRGDLLLARRALAPQFFKLVGGEPLLHPRLLDCLRIAHETAIAPIISVTTNGLLLGRMPDEFWALLNHLTISLYPHPRLSDEALAHVYRQVERHGLTLNLKPQDQFQEITLSQPRADEVENRVVFADCWLRHRCHLLRDGWFFSCTRPPHFDTYYGTDSFARADGVRLHEGESLAGEILDLLVRTEPLASCRLCVGGDGPRFPHRQLTRLEVLSRCEGTP